MVTSVKKQQTEIQSPAVYRYKDKVTHEVYYVVKSDSVENTWYEVHFDGHALTWRCTCPALKPCKHERAVNEVLKIRRATTAAQMGPSAVIAVGRMQADEDRKLAAAEVAAERRQHAALNGDRSFRLLK